MAIDRPNVYQNQNVLKTEFLSGSGTSTYNNVKRITVSVLTGSLTVGASGTSGADRISLNPANPDSVWEFQAPDGEVVDSIEIQYTSATVNVSYITG